HAEEARHRPGLAALALRRQAVGSTIEGVDRRIALVDERGLAMDFPAARTTIVGLRFLLVLDAELVVQADAELIKAVLRIVARGRRAEHKAAEAEVGVEVLEAGGPARIE